MSTNTIKPAMGKPAVAKPGARVAARHGAAQAGSKKTRNIIIASVLALLVIIPSTVWAVIHFRHLSRINKAKAIAAAAFDGMDKKNGQQRREAFDDMRQQIDSLGLSDAEKRELRDQGRESFVRRQDEEMNKYFTMSAADRAAFMRQKAAEEAKRFDDRAAKNNSGSGSGNRSGSGNSNGQGDRGGRGRGGNNTTGESAADRRSDFRKQRLDQTTPLQRAQMAMYRQDMTRAIGDQNAIRSQQGLPAIPLPGMGGRGGRGFGR